MMVRPPLQCRMEYDDDCDLVLILCQLCGDVCDPRCLGCVCTCPCDCACFVWDEVQQSVGVMFRRVFPVKPAEVLPVACEVVPEQIVIEGLVDA